MIKYFNGTVFNCNAMAVVNTVNCQGFMGAGIALEFALRFPDMLKDYESKCKKGKIMVGCVDYFYANEKIIVNFPTKKYFKYPSKIEWIEQGLIHFVKTYKDHNITSVAFPKLGTSNGGLKWEEVKQIMEKYLNPIDIPAYICLDVNEAEGLEKEMLDVFNSLDLTMLKPYMRISKKQKSILEENRPIRRFWMIKNLDGIGITFYTNIFNYCKDVAQIGSGTQLSLFDNI